MGEGGLDIRTNVRFLRVEVKLGIEGKTYGLLGGVKNSSELELDLDREMSMLLLAWSWR